jgi:hypothetical protein
MIRISFFIILISFSIGLYAQEDFKKPDPFTLNLVAAYEAPHSFSDLNNKLTANGFEKVTYSPFGFGFEFSGSGKRSFLIDQFYFGDLFTSKSGYKTRITVTNISILYGYDILPKAKLTYLYPLAGLRLHDISINSKRTDDIKIDAHKPVFEALLGLGARQFLNRQMKGVFNNVGLNFLLSLPVINSRWRKDGREFISGTYTIKPAFSMNLSFGRGFYPASN